MTALTASLRGRLLLAFLGPAVVFLIALGILAVHAARATLEDEVGARLTDTAAATAALLPAGVIARYAPGNERTYASLQGKLAAVRDRVGARRVFLATLDGRSLVDSEPQGTPAGDVDPALMQDRFELEQVGRGEQVASVLFKGLDGLRYLRGYAPVWHVPEADAPEAAPGVRRVVAAVGVEGSGRNYAGIDRLGAYMTTTIALALLALGLMVTWVSRALTSPLARLVEAARSIGAGRLEEPVGAPGGSIEIRTLSHTMEEMRVALLARDRELQMMLGGIAHEVRNPLGGMELFVGLLREDLAGAPDQLELLTRVERELGNLKRVVEEFLAYARQVPLDARPVPLAALVAEIAPLAAGLRIETTVPADVVVQGDRQQLGRLVLNLARNAAQAGAGRVVVGFEGDRLTVTDDGPGVPSEAADRIFDAFYTTREKGTGLGLALCRKLAAAHGAVLRLENPGAPGACFSVGPLPRVTPGPGETPSG
ncbi:HAMP domain-containing histidine kinase [Myxococcota bacterium]|nr:HAMP domain-containing histidine kinase [Myxococcota bacterium]